MTSRRKQRFRSLFKWMLGILGGFFLLSEFMGSFLVSGARVSSRSMAPNYATGDRVIISRLAYGMTLPFSEIPLPAIAEPRHGQVVVMRGPQRSERHLSVVRDLWDFFTLNSPPPGRKSSWERGFILRRVIAIPGDRVYLSGGQAFVQIQGSGDFLPERLIGTESYELLLPEGEFDNPDLLNNYYTNSFVLPEGEVFVLPDNRLEAFGSQSWGGLPLNKLRGRVLWRLPSEG